MIEYRFFESTSSGVFGNMSVHRFPHDQAAIDFARSLLTLRSAIDIWRGDRRVALVESKAAA